MQKQPVKKSLLYYLNFPRRVCDLTLGEQHRPHHRMIAGTIIMVIGVSLCKAFASFHYFFIPEITEGIGYAIHAIGATPFVEYLSKQVNDKI